MKPISTSPALDRLLEPLEKTLTADVAKQIVNLRADAATQRRIDELADKANEGTLTPDEAAEYDDFIEAIELIGLLQTKARALLAKSIRS